MTEKLTSHFKHDWHSVGRGVKVEIVRHTIDWAGHPVVIVRRLDGEELPQPFGAWAETAAVAPEYIA